MKIIAYYLPQFHEIKENNEWWGKGFTEWTNVKRAKSLFKGHHQPIEPLNDNYYNLLDKETVKWQAELAKKYNVYGFCYYHYWFEGRKILEKPAENLLEWKDIDKKYCFCWANHSWKKTWNGTMEMLIEQGYGNETEWEEHFNYLIDFFKDDRYIKIDNKPVFMIYSAKDVNNLDERIKFYEKKCIEHGFAGIFFIESLNNKRFKPVSEVSDAIVLREPTIGITSSSSILNRIIHKIKSGFKKNYLLKPMTYKFNTVCENSLEYAENIKSNKRVFLGSFTGWDSTTRHGRRGYILTGNTPERFIDYLMKQKKILSERNEEYIFMNAWNEWAEGMYLEPDKRNGYKYLEAIKKVTENN
jgi:hypothetical protein